MGMQCIVETTDSGHAAVESIEMQLGKVDYEQTLDICAALCTTMMGKDDATVPFDYKITENSLSLESNRGYADDIGVGAVLAPALYAVSTLRARTDGMRSVLTLHRPSTVIEPKS